MLWTCLRAAQTWSDRCRSIKVSISEYMLLTSIILCVLSVNNFLPFLLPWQRTAYFKLAMHLRRGKPRSRCRSIKVSIILCVLSVNNCLPFLLPWQQTAYFKLAIHLRRGRPHSERDSLSVPCRTAMWFVAKWKMRTYWCEVWLSVNGSGCTVQKANKAVCALKLVVNCNALWRIEAVSFGAWLTSAKVYSQLYVTLNKILLSYSHTASATRVPYAHTFTIISRLALW